MVRTPCIVRKMVMLFGALFVSVDTNAAEQVPSKKGNEMATLGDGLLNNGSSNNYRQDFCSRVHNMGNSSDHFSIKDALSGSELSVHLMIDEYFRYSETDGIDPEYPGINALILDYIAEKGNFTWRNSFGVSTWESLGNASVTELLEWGVEKYDLMVSIYTPSAERINLGIGFVDGFFDGSLIMTRIKENEEKTEIDWISFLRPFEADVWYMILAVIIFSSICHRFIEQLGGQYDSEISFRKWLMENIYLSFINATGNYSYEPKSLAGRVFGVLFALWALLLTAAYTANLASFYILHQVSEPPVVDLLDAIEKGFPICVQRGTFSEDFLRERYREYSPNLVLIDIYDWANALKRGDCEVAVTYKQEFGAYKMKQEANPFCLLEWQGRPINQMLDGFATKIDFGMKCTDLVNWVLSYYIREMQDEGFLEEKWQEHNTFYGTDGHCLDSGRTRRQLETQERQIGGPHRHLKSISMGGAAGGAASARTDEVEHAMTVKEMAGTMAIQVVGSLFAILIALLGKCEGKVFGRNNGKRSRTRKTVPVSDHHLRAKCSELAQTMSKMQKTLVKMQKDLEERDESFFFSDCSGSECSDMNRNTNPISEGRFVAQQSFQMDNLESDTFGGIDYPDSRETDDSAIVFFNTDHSYNSDGSGDNLNTESGLGLGTFHTHVSTPQPEG